MKAYEVTKDGRWLQMHRCSLQRKAYGWQKDRRQSSKQKYRRRRTQCGDDWTRR
jgi:hypothetical protein